MISILLEVFYHHGLTICKKSLQEIQWAHNNGFIYIPNIQNYSSNTVIESKYGDLLVFSTLQSQADHVVDSLLFDLSPQPNTVDNILEQPSESLLTNKTSNSVFFPRNSEHIQTNRSIDDEQYCESFLKLDDMPPCCIDVTGFIEIENHVLENEVIYSTVKLVPGNTCSLASLKKKTYMKIIKERDVIDTEEIEKLIATFSSHEFLWQSLQQYPVGSALFSKSGFALVKSEISWNIYFNLPINDLQEKTFCPLFRLIHSFNVLNVKLDHYLSNFFAGLCRLMAKDFGETVDHLSDMGLVALLCSLEQSNPSITEKAKEFQYDIIDYINAVQQNTQYTFKYINDTDTKTKIQQLLTFKFHSEKCAKAKSLLRGTEIDHPVLSDEFMDRSENIVSKIQIHEDKPVSNFSEIPSQSLCYSLFNNNPEYLLFLNVPFDFPILKYERSVGMNIGFIVRSTLIQGDTGERVLETLKWATVMLLSGLPNATKMCVLKNFYTDFVSQNLTNHLSPNLNVMLYSIAKQCPITSKGDIFMEACTITNTEMLTKKSNYSIHFVSCQGIIDTLQLLKEMMEIEILDYTEYYRNGSFSLPQIYLSIIEPFTRNKCGVYVKGLTEVKDALLKWCAEFTKDVPWAFIYFEEPITSYNLPENLDRCYPHEEYCRQVLDNKDKHLRNTFTMRYTTRNAPPKLLSSTSKYKKDWKKQIMTVASDPNERCILISGPPGIGKSFFFEQQTIPYDYYFDGSKDILVRSSLVDILEFNTRTLIKQDTVVFVVIIDEYHMLSPSHKRQLFSWAKKNSLVKLILISNRHDISDTKLLEAYFGGNITNNIIHCSGVFEEMRKHYFPDEDDVTNGTKERRLYRAMYLWYHSTRNLFGEEMMTYRIFKSVKECLENIIDKTDTDSKDKLATILQNKQPSFTKLFCQYYVSTLLDFISKEELFIANCGGPKTFDDLDQRLVNEFSVDNVYQYLPLLVSTSLLISKTQDNLTFPEFSNNIENEYQYHVVLRLKAFISYMCGLKSITLSEQELEKVQHLLLCCEVIDKPSSFPQLKHSTKLQSLEECAVECVSVDFNNLEMIHSMLVRGYAIDFHQAKKFWEKKPIQNPKQFEKILSAYPPVAGFISEENTFSLLKRSSETSLCRYLLKEDDRMHPKNCFYLSCWKLYKEELCSLSNAPLESQSKIMKVTKIPEGQSLEVDKLRLLVWVSKYGRSLLDINCSVSNFEQVFVQELYFLTNIVDVDNKHDISMLCELWSGLFSCYLKVAPESCAVSDVAVATPLAGINFLHAVLIAKQFYPPLPDWAPTIQIISRLWYTPCESLKELELIASFEEFWSCLERREFNELLESFVMSPALTMSLKKRILTSPYLINVSSHDFLADVVNNFSEALLSISIEEIRLKEGEFLRKCREYIANSQETKVFKN